MKLWQKATTGTLTAHTNYYSFLHSVTHLLTRVANRLLSLGAAEAAADGNKLRKSFSLVSSLKTGNEETKSRSCFPPFSSRIIPWHSWLKLGSVGRGVAFLSRGFLLPLPFSGVSFLFIEGEVEAVLWRRLSKRYSTCDVDLAFTFSSVGAVLSA